jgi:DNA-directed RNA polymerase I subunit RPA49
MNEANIVDRRRRTDNCKHRLYSYMLVICLHLDQFSLLLTTLSKDLSLPSVTLKTYLRGLGCRIKSLSAAERERLGVTPGDAQVLSKAVLTVPLKFEENRRRGRR